MRDIRRQNLVLSGIGFCQNTILSVQKQQPVNTRIPDVEALGCLPGLLCGEYWSILRSSFGFDGIWVNQP